jgi:hydrogenase nickel incorporation protein HypA/HybF
MHELGIAAEIHRVCREAASAHGPGRLVRVKVAVGELSAVEPELLRYAWEAVTGEGPDGASVLEVDWRPAKQFCASCGENRPRADGSWLRLCPDCGQPLRVEGGDELDILEAEFEADREAAGGTA